MSQNALELNNIQYIGRYLVQPTPDERWATDVAESELTQSMSRKSNCLDNAVAEIFTLLKQSCITSKVLKMQEL